jgi:ACS family glucarate transporter-like MFS transporter
VLGFGCSLALLTYLDRICIMQAKESIRLELGFSDKDMGLIFSAFLVGYLLLEVPGGWMGDRWGSRRVLAGIVLVWSLFTALTGCVWPFVLDSGGQFQLGGLVIPLAINSLAAMLLIRFLFGLGEAGAFPNLTRLVPPVRTRFGPGLDLDFRPAGRRPGAGRPQRPYSDVGLAASLLDAGPGRRRLGFDFLCSLP